MPAMFMAKSDTAIIHFILWWDTVDITNITTISTINHANIIMCPDITTIATMFIIMVTKNIITHPEDTVVHVIEKVQLLNHKPFEGTQKAFFI